MKLKCFSNYCLIFFQLFIAVFIFGALEAGAQDATVVAPAMPQPSIGEVLSKMAPMFLVVFVVFHFFIIRPQKKKDADHAALVSALKVGDTVVTSSGMLGKVSTLADKHVTIEVAPNVKIKFEHTAIVKREDKI